MANPWYTRPLETAQNQSAGLFCEWLFSGGHIPSITTLYDRLGPRIVSQKTVRPGQWLFVYDGESVRQFVPSNKRISCSVGVSVAECCVELCIGFQKKSDCKLLIPRGRQRLDLTFQKHLFNWARKQLGVRLEPRPRPIAVRDAKRIGQNCELESEKIRGLESSA